METHVANARNPPTVPSRGLVWTGRLLSTLPVLMLTLSGVMKFAQPPQLIEGFANLGWPLELATTLGVIELGCVVLYLLPPTSVLGAVLLTGYLGGAIATHVRIDDAWYGGLVLGVLVWLGLYLREPRLWSLLPLRR